MPLSTARDILFGGGYTPEEEEEEETATTPAVIEPPTQQPISQSQPTRQQEPKQSSAYNILFGEGEEEYEPPSIEEEPKATTSYEVEPTEVKPISDVDVYEGELLPTSKIAAGAHRAIGTVKKFLAPEIRKTAFLHKKPEERTAEAKRLEEEAPIHGKAAEILDPTWYRSEKINEKIEKIRGQDPNLANAFKMGDISGAADINVTNAFLSGDETAKNIALNTAQMARETGGEFAEKREKRTGITGKATNVLESVSEMLPMMGKSAALNAIPGVGQAMSASMWAMQGTGDIITQLKDEGVDDDTALAYGLIGGMAYSLVEQVQIGRITNVGKKVVGESVRKKLLNLAKEKGLDWLQNVREEVIQGIVTENAILDAMKASGIEVDRKEVHDRYTTAIKENFTGSAWPMAVLSLAGLGAGAGRIGYRAGAEKKGAGVSKATDELFGTEKKPVEAVESLKPEEGIQQPPTETEVAQEAVKTTPTVEENTLESLGVENEAAFFSLPEDQQNDIYRQLSDEERDRVLNYEEQEKVTIEGIREKVEKEEGYAEGVGREIEETGEQARGLGPKEKTGIHLRYDEKKDQLEAETGKEIEREVPSERPTTTTGEERVTETAPGTERAVAEGEVPKAEQEGKIRKSVESVKRDDRREKREVLQVDLVPSEGQKETGNYRKAHIKRDGFDISLENPAGSQRSGTDKSGKKWSQKINHDYGYIRGTKGADAFRTKGGTDQVDAFIKPNSKEGGTVYIVNQVDPSSGKFDEHKAMMGFGSKEEARRAYLSNYEKGWKGLGSIYEIPMDEFKEWVFTDETKYPYKGKVEYKKPAEEMPVTDGMRKRARLLASKIPGVKVSGKGIGGGTIREGKVETEHLIWFDDEVSQSTMAIKVSEGIKELRKTINNARKGVKGEKETRTGVVRPDEAPERKGAVKGKVARTKGEKPKAVWTRDKFSEEDESRLESETPESLDDIEFDEQDETDYKEAIALMSMYGEIEEKKLKLDQAQKIYDIIKRDIFGKIDAKSFGREGDPAFILENKRLFARTGGKNVDRARMEFISKNRDTLSEFGIEEGKLDTPSDFVEFLRDVSTRKEISRLKNEIKEGERELEEYEPPVKFAKKKEKEAKVSPEREEEITRLVKKSIAESKGTRESAAKVIEAEEGEFEAGELKPGVEVAQHKRKPYIEGEVKSIIEEGEVPEAKPEISISKRKKRDYDTKKEEYGSPKEKRLVEAVYESQGQAPTPGTIRYAKMGEVQETLANVISNISKEPVNFIQTNQEALNRDLGFSVDGFRLSGEKYGDLGGIYIDVDSERPVLWTAMHETVHALPAAQKKHLYDAMKLTDEGLAKKAEEGEEFLADVAGEMMSRQDFWENLEKQSPGTLKTIVNKLIEILNKVAKEIRALIASDSENRAEYEDYLLDVDGFRDELIAVVKDYTKGDIKDVSERMAAAIRRKELGVQFAKREGGRLRHTKKRKGPAEKKQSVYQQQIAIQNSIYKAKESNIENVKQSLSSLADDMGLKTFDRKKADLVIRNVNTIPSLQQAHDILGRIYQKAMMGPDGVQTKIKYPNKKPSEITTPLADNIVPPYEKRLADVYQAIRNKGNESIWKKIRRGEKSFKEVRDTFFSDLLVPFSTRLKKINPDIRNQLKRLESDIMKWQTNDAREVMPFLKKWSKMKPVDRKILDSALKHSDDAMVQKIVKRYGVEKEYESTRSVLDDIWGRAQSVGFDINYIPKYWPRSVINAPKLIEHIAKHPSWGIFEAEINRASEELGRPLSDSEKARIINGIMARPDIDIQAPGALKERTIDIIDDTIDKWYDYSPSALVNYIHDMNHAIEMKRFLGKGDEVEKLINVDKGISRYIVKMIDEGKLDPSKQDELIGLLRAKFNYQTTKGLPAKVKSVGYMSTLGSGYSSCFTQIGDLAWAYYAVSPFKASKALFKSVSNKLTGSRAFRDALKKEDVWIERIAEEFRTSRGFAKALNNLFKITGLTAFDDIGKETLINGLNDSYRSRAKKKNNTRFYNELKSLFGNENEAKGAIRDFKGNKDTDLTKYVILSRVLNFQPVALTEMPRFYLEHPNARVLYMLKTFTIKQLDVFRNEALSKMRTGIANREPKEFAEGFANLLRLVVLFTMANMAGDAVKDWVFGRRPSLSEMTVDNIFRLFGLSRYITWEIRREGIDKAIFGLAMPPLDIVSDPVRDVDKFVRNFMKDERDSTKKPFIYHIKNARTWRNIPIFGKHYYWWFGGGKESVKKQDFERMAKLALKDGMSWDDKYKYDNWLDSLDYETRNSYFNYFSRFIGEKAKEKQD